MVRRDVRCSCSQSDNASLHQQKEGSLHAEICDSSATIVSQVPERKNVANRVYGRMLQTEENKTDGREGMSMFDRNHDKFHSERSPAGSERGGGGCIEEEMEGGEKGRMPGPLLQLLE
jgi:hypothetical protein